MSDLNFNELQKRILQVKLEEEQTVSFTRDFIECLIKRHDLTEMLDYEFDHEDIPNSIIEYIRKEEVPPKEELEVLDAEQQDFLLKDFIFMCGMGAIAYYSDHNPIYKDMDPKPFDSILKMPDMSPGHHTASYIVAALALLLSDIPAQDMTESLTNKFDPSDEQIEKNVLLFNELCVSILKRYLEDKAYYLK